MYKKIRIRYEAMRRAMKDPYILTTDQMIEEEAKKSPGRTDLINFLISTIKNARYLEIGVRNPAHNFDKINAAEKYSVDPGLEFLENPVDFKLASDDFFQQLESGKILSKDFLFDVIFIDGLHTAEQTDRDIINGLKFLKDNGFLVLHDCNPTSEFHARENYNYFASPAFDQWNGTTWKAFFRHRKRDDVYSCCLDSDWGVGIISKKVNLGEPSTVSNDFYEYTILDKFRKESLNLLSFEELRSKLKV